MFKRDPLAGRISAQIDALTQQVVQLRGERTTLELEQELTRLTQEKLRLTNELDSLQESTGRHEREIEHKLGLHRAQIESEREIMKAEASAERLRSVEETKLAVREENLGAERKRFEEEIEFRTKRFEGEAATLRDLTGQILQRLPNVTASFTQHIGPEKPVLGAGDGAGVSSSDE